MSLVVLLLVFVNSEHSLSINYKVLHLVNGELDVLVSSTAAQGYGSDMKLDLINLPGSSFTERFGLNGSAFCLNLLKVGV